MPQIARATNCFRIGTPQWLGDARFEALLALFEKYKGVTDEITFFTSETHPPLPLDVIAQRAQILAGRIEACRRFGYRAGINILATLGHHNENLPHSLDTDFTRMTDLDGGTCAGSFCPNDEHMRAYIARLYRITAGANPDYIWIDDDVRLFGHMPIRCGCFCDKCLEIFSSECGVVHTRDSLRQAFDTGSMAEKLAMRRAWLDHNRDTLIRLFRLIEWTCHEIKPELPLGFMTGERYFEGYGFDGLAETLAGPRATPVMWRPGGGAYTDESFDAFLQKAHQIGRQLAYVPESVVLIQSEIENFPYQRLKKSRHAVGLEAGLYIAAGCTGAAYNVLSMYDEPLDEYEPLVAHLSARRPFLDTLASLVGRAAPSGIYTGWCKDSFAARAIGGGHWFDGGGPDPTDHANELFVNGLPMAYRPEHAPVAALSGDSLTALDDAAIRRILSGGVYLDPSALTRLNDMGYGEYTGFTIEGAKEVDCIEQFLDHPLNQPFAGRRRDGRQSFWKSPCVMLKPAPGAAPLARVIDYAAQETAPCCLGVFENSLGGRVCAAGYYPWSHLHNLSKSSQIKAIFRWLSRDTLPGYIDSYHRMTLWVRPAASGGCVAIICNCSQDVAENAVIALRTDRQSARCVSADNTETPLTAAEAGPYRLFQMPRVAPWELAIIDCA